MSHDLKEQAFWRNELKGPFHALGHCCRIESHATALGVPDTNLKINQGPEWWIEVKMCDDPAGIVTVRPSQWGWRLKRIRAGGRVMFITKWIQSSDSTLYLINSQVPHGNCELEAWALMADAKYRGRINWQHLERILKDEQSM